MLTRTLRRLGTSVRERTRSVARRVFEIAQRSRTTSARTSPAVRERTRARMKLLYRGLLGITRRVVREAETVIRRLPARPRPRVRSLIERLPTTLDTVHQVLAQTRARVLRGDPHYRHKVVGAFEPHTEIIRKGKLAKPTEFGRLVKIQQAESQVITDYQVCEHGVSDRALWVRWIGTAPSSAARRTWPWLTADLPRQRMTARRCAGALGARGASVL